MMESGGFLTAMYGLPDRFLEKITIDSSECWIWNSVKDAGGYGLFRVNGKWVKTHRYTFEMAGGTLNESLVIDHLCKVRECCNPHHLEQVTMGENTRRGNAVKNRKAQAATITKCVQGHEFTPDNTYEYKGRRMCKACRASRRNVARDARRKNVKHS